MCCRALDVYASWFHLTDLDGRWNALKGFHKIYFISAFGYKVKVYELQTEMFKHRVVEVLYHSFFLLDYCYIMTKTPAVSHIFLLLLYIQNIPVKSIQLGWISQSIPYNVKMWDTAGVFVMI